MPVDNVAANSAATSGWANQVADSVNDIEGDIYASGQLAIPWAAITGEPTSFVPAAHKASHAFGGSDPLGWADIGGKPATFPAAAHAASHAAGAADPLTPTAIGAAAAYDTPAVLDGGKRIYVGTAAPTGASEGDIWIQK